MEIWLDTINTTLIQEAALSGLISGVTTNPAILSESFDVADTLKTLLNLQEGYVAIQVIAARTKEMVEEGEKFFALSNRIIVKIPVNREGLMAIHQLVQRGVPVLGTAIIHPKQAYLAAKLGAVYVAPYFSHIAKTGVNPCDVLETIRKIFQMQNLKTKIMVASVKQIESILQGAEMGIDAVTLKDEVYTKFLENDPLSEACTNALNLQWRKSQHANRR